jgi:hypothetical protein
MVTKMTQKRVSQKIKWNREFYLLRYPDGKYVSLTSHLVFAIPKPVEKEDAYLFTPSKADAYLSHYQDQFQLEKISVQVYLE